MKDTYDDAEEFDLQVGPGAHGDSTRSSERTTTQRRKTRLRRASKQDVADSVRSLAMMLTVQRGELLPVKTLAEQYAGTKLGAAYASVADGLADGVPFAQALSEEVMFPPVVRRMVLIGAATGNPGPHLTRAADLLDESAETSGKVRSALLEPAILGVGVVVFFIAMVTWAVPQMLDVFSSTGVELPALSRLALTISGVMQVVIPVLAVIAGVLGVWWRTSGRKSEGLRTKLDGFWLKVPVLGPLRREAALANSLSVLAALMDLGISEREALLTAAAGCENRAIAAHLRAHARDLTTGAATFPDLADGYLIPLPIGAVLSAAASAGQLPMGLAHVADTYRRTSRLKADNLSTALGPIANVVVGALFAGAVIIIYVPMYSMFTAVTAF